MTEVKYKNSPIPSEIATLEKGIREYDQERGMSSQQEVMLYIEVNGGQIAGCICKQYHNSLRIKKLWVDKRFRNHGFGTDLMEEAEKYAKEQNCTFIIVHTMSWHAPDFYKKLGYRVEFERSGYPKGTSLYVMRKDIYLSRS